MDEMSGILIVVLLIVGILNVVLWFKIWFMTDNVEKITKMMEDHFNPPEVGKKDHNDWKPKVGN